MMMMMVEPKHTCSNTCSFQGRVCVATRNTHTCTHTCVVLNSESNYVCIFTGIVTPGTTSLSSGPSSHVPPPQKTTINRTKIWIRVAVAAILVHTDARASIAALADTRRVAKIRRIMGPTPWSARTLASTLASLHKQPFTGHGAPPQRLHQISLLVNSLHSYYTRFAHTVFPTSRRSVSTYVAVMIDALTDGIHDINSLTIVPQSPWITHYVPALIDYPKLNTMVTCKAMSTGRFALRVAAATPAGIARRIAIYTSD